MKKIYFGLTIIAIVGGAVWFVRPKNTLPNPLDSFAQCLAQKGATMYGADWCPHCQNEKKAFGSAFRYVPYVECPADPKKCLNLGIQGYPTWILGDGQRLEGEQGLGKLSRESECALPDNL